MIIYTSVSRERKARLMINHVISRVMTHRDMNTLEDIFVGYEIWGFLVMLTYDIEFRNMIWRMKIWELHSKIHKYRTPQICLLRYLYHGES